MLLDEPVEIVPFDRRWRELFEAERAAISRALGTAALGIEHIGSTAVPGLAAKPIVDIMIGLARVPPASETIDRLRQLRYEYLGEAGVPGRHYFRRRDAGRFNLAVVEHGGPLWRANLAIRDHLRRHPDAAAEYEEVKRAALAAGKTMLLEYSAAKGEYLERLRAALE